MLAPLGSIVVYMGKKWINACRNYQPVWGVKRNEAKQSADSKKTTTKSFSELLKEARNGTLNLQNNTNSTDTVQNNQKEPGDDSVDFYI